MKYFDNKKLEEGRPYVFEYPEVTFMAVLISKTSYWTHKECEVDVFINLNTGYHGSDATFYNYNEVREPTVDELAYHREMIANGEEIPFKNYKTKSDYEVF
jgi:hypothetical protein